MTDNTTTLAGPPAGWYTDPQGVQRWWDGQVWTQHVAPTPASAGVPAAVAAAAVAPVVAAQEPAAAEPAAPVAPVLPVVPTRSQDLFPAAAEQSSRRGSSASKLRLPQVALPELSPLQWVGVGAALVALAGGIFYFTRPSGDTAGQGTVPGAQHQAAGGTVLDAKSGAVLSAFQVAHGLPSVTALGPGWVVDPDHTLNLGTLPTGAPTKTTPAVCGLVLDAIPPGSASSKPLAHSAASFTSPTTHGLAAVAVLTYKSVLPTTLLTGGSKLLPACKNYTTAGGGKFSITGVSFPKYGDAAVLVKTSSFIGKTPFTWEMLTVHEGHNIIVVGLVGQPATLPAQLDRLTKATLAQLPR